MRCHSLALTLLCLGVCPASAFETPAAATPRIDTLAAADVVGAPRGTPLTGANLDTESWRVGSLLRCPVCQGASIVDSPAPTALDMRGQVRAMLAAGYTERQVLAYFEHSFGAFVRLDPPARGVNLALWLAPAAALAAGGAILLAFLRRSRSTAAIAPGADSAHAAVLPSPESDDPRLKEYLDRVRALTNRDDHSRGEDSRKA
jgi:cytochrome c-type biogenesis protein CcmH